MNREIKFRAWDSKTKQMGIPFSPFPNRGGVLDKHIILMQYTGLKDKNCKELYEGDIVKGDFWIGKDIGEIRFGNYVGQTTNDDFYYGTGFYISLRNDSEMFGIDKEDSLEVIGNIYENPEHLK